MIPVFDWERRLQGFILRISSPFVNILRWVNIGLAGEEVMTSLAPLLTLMVYWQRDGLTAILFLAAILACPRMEAWAKPMLGQRGRPRDAHELGLPSGDCAYVAIWALTLLGGLGMFPIMVVAWCRMALNAHWPLDTVAGVAQGAFLALPAILYGWGVL